MKLFTYTGETPDEALRQAKSVHGDDPFILKSREIRKKSLSQRGLYEIVIAVEGEVPEDPSKASNSVKKKLDEIVQKSFEKKRNPKVSLDQDPEQVAKQISESVLNRFDPYSKTPQQVIQKTQGHEELKAIKKEIEQIDDRLKLIQSMFWEEKRPPSQNLNIPQEFAEIYNLAKNSGIDQNRLDALMELSLELMPLQMRSNSVTIKRYFREVLRKMISCRNESFPNHAKNILMFVGPTGVGKTTTLAKLAARYSLMLDRKYKVGVITLDSYKIAAMEQLMTYARMMRLGIERVDDPVELSLAIDRLAYCDFILIDTAGHSPYDNQKLGLLKEYTQNEFNIDISLVLSASTKYEDLKEIYQSFSAVEIDNLIFSKLDESRSFGNIFSLACEARKPISYFSIGQSVPNDLLVASNDFLVDCLLEGFKNPKKESK